jgi:hypothetical protein
MNSCEVDVSNENNESFYFAKHVITPSAKF